MGRASRTKEERRQWQALDQKISTLEHRSRPTWPTRFGVHLGVFASGLGVGALALAIYYSAPTIAPAYQDSRNPLVLGVKLTNDNLVSMLTETSCGLEARYENGPDMTNVGFGDDARGVIPPKSARNIACNLQDDLNFPPDPNSTLCALRHSHIA